MCKMNSNVLEQRFVEKMSERENEGKIYNSATCNHKKNENNIHHLICVVIFSTSWMRSIWGYLKSRTFTPYDKKAPEQQHILFYIAPWYTSQYIERESWKKNTFAFEMYCVRTNLFFFDNAREISCMLYGLSSRFCPKKKRVKPYLISTAQQPKWGKLRFTTFFIELDDYIEANFSFIQ